ncbi:hypothetical protein R1flu_003725 [Riccia fluitans]|uniref:NB-ARC domain-containing protein n=1 Tax=Riccia fluitans TaxID=41844 RepID=A0ABD1Y9X5_9MARC
MDPSEQEFDLEPLIPGAEMSGANGSLKSSLQKCIPCNCCWPWFTNTDYSHHLSQPTPESVERMSDAFYKLYEPVPACNATLDIFFFHGLECEGSNLRDAYKSSWTSTGEQEEVWPQKWLPSDFPQARIISVCYDSCTKQTDTDGRMDLHQIGENLMQEIKWARKEHGFHRPVILVGHGFGGIVIKKLCIYAQNKREKSVGGSDMSMFLDSIRAFFFYATPHLGIEGFEAPAEDEGPLLKWMRGLNSESARLHEAFSELWIARRDRWTIFGLGEVESMPGSGRGRLHVREASSRFGGNYMTVPSDHFAVCKPSDKNCNKYQHLKHLIEDVQKRVEFERSQSLMVPPVIVGVDVLVAEVREKLRDHKFVGFSGLGGVGKTTLAKLIFNRVCAEFEFTCFVEEIKLICGTKEEIKKKVWEKMRHHGRPVLSSSKSSQDGWYQVVGKSMFLIFDDIEDYRHAELLHAIAERNGMDESRFLLTSRNTQRLRDCKPDVHIISLECLEYQDARKLLTAYAFPDQEPPQSMKEVIRKVVVGCEGLPLTLEVLGKYLRYQPIELWAEIPVALRKCEEDIADLEQRVWATLKLSYDNLPSHEVKKMFLDIASFFILDGGPFSADDAMKAWSVTYGSALSRIKILEDRSLLKVGHYKNEQGFDCKRFHMHEHVRRMGQRIARQEGRISDSDAELMQSDSDDGNYYLYDDEILFKVYQTSLSSKLLKSGGLTMARQRTIDALEETLNQGGKELGKIVALITKNLSLVFAEDCTFCIMRQVWPKLTAIQYMILILNYTNCCSQCRNQTVALPSTLRLLILESSAEWNISVVADGNYLGNMTGTLSLATCTSLVRLKLRECKNVGDLSVLQRLRILEIWSCSVAENWATSLGELKSVERLELFGIEGPFELPISFGYLTGLQCLSIMSCKVTSIPDSFRNLTSLQSLEVEEVIDRQVIPIGSFRQLRSLKMTCWAIADLAKVFRELIVLEELTLKCEGILELPHTLGNLTLLRRLWVNCPVKLLPDSLGNLTNLESLVLVSPIQTLPVRFSSLTRLGTLDLHCEDAGTEVIFQNWNSWGKAKPLEMWVLGKDAAPDVLRHLQWHWSSVKSLILRCDHGATASVVSNMINLVTLEILVKGRQAVPDIFGNLKKLRRLMLYCSAVENNLVESFTGMSSLEDIQLKQIDNLQALSGMIGQLSHLQSLSLSGLRNLNVIPESLGNLYSLQALEVWDCPNFQSLPETLGQLSSLRRLSLSFCRNLQTLPDSIVDLSSLQSLDLTGSTLDSLPDTIKNLSQLKSLCIKFCRNLETLPDWIGDLTSLRELDITPALLSLPDKIRNLPQLIITEHC